MVGVVGVEGKALTTEYSAQPEMPFATSVGKWVECQNVKTARELLTSWVLFILVMYQQLKQTNKQKH